MTQWKLLRREAFVGLRPDGRKSTDGQVEGFTPDGAVVWIRPTGGWGQVTIHRYDGFDIWRVDSRAIQIKFAGPPIARRPQYYGPGLIVKFPEPIHHRSGSICRLIRAFGFKN